MDELIRHVLNGVAAQQAVDQVLSDRPHLAAVIDNLAADRGRQPSQIAPASLCNPPHKPKPLQYVAKHSHVMQGAARVAVAKSHTFAKRIAKALNCLDETERSR